ncbi:MAG: ATP synthase F0 subunit B [Thermodesulfobacteriota bacterium]
MGIAGLGRIVSVGKQCAVIFAAAVSGATSAYASGGGISVIPDASVIVQIVNFLLLIWALNMLLYKPIRKMIAQRKEKVSGLEKSVEKLSQDAQRKDDAYGEGIKDARTKGLKQKQMIVDAAAEEEAKLIAEINRKAQENLAETKEKIAKDTASVRGTLAKEIDAFAAIIGEKILGRAM